MMTSIKGYLCINKNQIYISALSLSEEFHESISFFFPLNLFQYNFDNNNILLYYI